MVQSHTGQVRFSLLASCEWLRKCASVLNGRKAYVLIWQANNCSVWMQGRMMSTEGVCSRSGVGGRGPVDEKLTVEGD